MPFSVRHVLAVAVRLSPAEEKIFVEYFTQIINKNTKKMQGVDRYESIPYRNIFFAPSVKCVYEKRVSNSSDFF